MKDYSYISQLTTTLIFLCMCRLVLVNSFYKRTGIIFYLYITVCCLIIAPFSGQLGTPLLLIGSSLILFLISKDSRIINLLLFQLLWFWSILTDYVITIPLSLLNYSFAELRTSFLLNMVYSILHALLCILPCLFIGNRLHRKLVTNQNVIPPRIQLLLFLEVTICSCIFLINIIFGSLLHYPSDILFFNGILIFCFATANVLIFLMLYNTLQANKKLELQAREQENLTHYMAQLENHYQDIRRFKHDYLNILSTITGYIQENDMDKLRNYFDSNIVTSSSILVNQDDTLARLSLIKVTEIKGLLYTKMVQAMNRQLDVSFELTQESQNCPPICSLFPECWVFFWITRSKLLPKPNRNGFILQSCARCILLFFILKTRRSRFFSLWKSFSSQVFLPKKRTAVLDFPPQIC